MKNCLVLAAVVMAVIAGEAVTPAALAQTRARPSLDLLRGVQLPKADQDPLTADIAAWLSTTQIPTVADALKFGIGAGRAPDSGIDARDSFAVTGLYMVRDQSVTGTRAGRDLMWEVRDLRLGDVVRVVWISATTKSVKILFDAS